VRTNTRETVGERDGKARLILAAEALFAKGGIDGVSLRQIASEAGQGNHHAVQYHFATREGLVQAVFDYRMRQMEPARGEMLAAAKLAGRLKDARTLIEVIFIPQLYLADESGNNHYASFLSQYLQRSHGTRFGDFGSELPPNLNRTLKLLRRRLDYLPEPIAQRRLLTACFMFLNILASYNSGRVRTEADEDFESALDDTLNQIVLATCLPYAPRPEDLPLGGATPRVDMLEKQLPDK
jgi:AcrR family transcriptional regulator